MEVEMDIKSNRTYKAAQKLLDAGLFTQSIHCWYYTVLQMAKFKLAHCGQKPLSYEQQMQNNSLSRGSSHDWLLFEICNRLSNKRVKNTFEEDFSFLKEDRVSADYRLKDFTQEEAACCKEISERMLANLRYIK